jgi:hypothetical protein
MNLEQQVCALELAKRLKELGVKQKSYFVYAREVLVPEFRYGGYAETRPDIWKLIEPFIYSAFTVSELGEMLPSSDIYPTSDLTFWIAKINSAGDRWQTDILRNGKSLHIDSDKNEANLRAKMLIYLLENSLMELPE